MERAGAKSVFIFRVFLPLQRSRPFPIVADQGGNVKLHFHSPAISARWRAGWPGHHFPLDVFGSRLIKSVWK